MRRKLLWFTIMIASLVRLVAPFEANPLDYISSDMYRHYHNATDPFAFEVFNLTDQVGYQFWLSAVLALLGSSHTAIAVYAAVISLLTPWLWYRWMQECIPSRALEGYAVLSLAPNWIKIFSLFMQETLLLPLLGLALWLSWRACRRRHWLCDLGASLVWGCALVTKASALPIFAIVWLWLAKRRYSETGGKALVGVLLSGFAALFIYNLTDLKVYCLTGIYGTRHMLYNEIYFESGAKLCFVTMILPDFDNSTPAHKVERTIEMDFGSPSAFSRELEPFSDWMSKRDGDTRLILHNLDAGPYRVRPDLVSRLYWTWEDVVFFLFGKCWPGHYFISEAGENLRWIWAPMAFAVFLAALLYPERRYDILTVLCLGSLGIFVLQQSFALEGRHRMPWEGLDLAAYLALFAPTKATPTSQ